MHNSTERRIAELEELLVETERQLVALHRGEVTESPPPPPPPPPRRTPPPPPPPSGLPTPPPPSVSPSSSFGAEMLLRYAGVAMVVASAIFFVSTAISRGWIGPTAQLALATITSLVMIGSSFRFAQERRPWAITMAVAGATSLFVTGAVGFLGLNLLSFPVAVGWLIVSLAAYVLLARLLHAESIAIASAPALIAGIVMLRYGAEFEPSFLSLLGSAYVVAITGAAHLRGWFWARSLGAAAGAGVAGLEVLALFSIDSSTSLIVGLFATAVIAILVAGASQAIEFARIDSGDHTNPAAIIEARVAALIIPWLSVLTAAVAVEIGATSIDFFWVVAVVGSIAGVVVAALRPLTISMRLLHGAAAIGTVAVALVAAADGPALLVALLVQALIAAALAYRFRTPDMIVLAAILGVVVAAITTGQVLNGALFNGLSVTGSLSILAVVVASGVVAWVLRRDGQSQRGWIVTWVLGLGWAAASFRDIPQGQMIVTLVWAAIGVALVVGGSRLLEPTVVHAGFVTLAVTATKLIFVDLVTVDVLWRAALFFVVGSLFLRLAFMLPQLTGVPTSSDGRDDGAGAATEPPLVDSGVGGR